MSGGVSVSEKIILLDRDGVVNYDSDDYIKSSKEWRPLPGSIQAISDLTQRGFRIYVITNQSGIGRGLFTVAALNRMHDKMRSLVAAKGGRIEGIYYCPHIPDDHCECRKPKVGLLRQLCAQENISTLRGVPFVGDSKSDLECAKQVDAQGILVKTGKGIRTVKQLTEPVTVPIFEDLAAVAKNLLEV